MKLIITFFLCSTLGLFSQNWNDSLWQEVNIYKNGEKMNFSDYRIKSVKCFDDECFMVLTNQFLFIEILKSTDDGETWNSIYDNYFDFMTEDPPEDFILYNPRLAEIQDTNTVILTYDDKNGILNKFDLHTFENDTTFKLNTISDIANLYTNSNGYGIACLGIYYYITKDNWETAEAYTTHSINDIMVTENNTFYNSNTNHSDTLGLFNRSIDGENWQQYKIGKGFIDRIYSFNNELFWAGGIELLKNGDRHDLIYNSTNSGATWELQFKGTSSKDYGIQEIQFITPEIGIALTYTQEYYTTTNGGKNWIKQFREINPNDIARNKTFLSPKYLFQFVGNVGLYRYNLSLLNITSVSLNKYKTLNIYPNPFNEYFNITNAGIVPDKYSLKIYDLKANLVLQKEIDYKSEMKIQANFPVGSYYLIIENENNHYIQRIIKE